MSFCLNGFNDFVGKYIENVTAFDYVKTIAWFCGLLFLILFLVFIILYFHLVIIRKGQKLRNYFLDLVL